MPAAVEPGVLSAMASPIVVNGRLWGAIVLLTPQHEPLPEDTEAEVVDFTEFIATAIANAESREARAVLAEEQAALRRVATLVAQGHRPSSSSRPSPRRSAACHPAETPPWGASNRTAA